MPWRLRGSEHISPRILKLGKRWNNWSAGWETEAQNEIFCLCLKSKRGSSAPIPINTVYSLSYPTLLLTCLRTLYSCKHLGKPATLICISTSFFNRPSTSRFSQTAFTTWLRHKKKQPNSTACWRVLSILVIYLVILTFKSWSSPLYNLLLSPYFLCLNSHLVFKQVHFLFL